MLGVDLCIIFMFCHATITYTSVHHCHCILSLDYYNNYTCITVHVSLYPRTSVHHCVTAASPHTSVRHCVTASPHQFITVHVSQHNTSVHHCIPASVHHYITTLLHNIIHLYINVSLHPRIRDNAHSRSSNKYMHVYGNAHSQ